MTSAYEARVPTPAEVDEAVAVLRNVYPGGLDRPDYVDGVVMGLTVINRQITNAIESGDLPDEAVGVLCSLSRNLGDNFSLYAAVRDALFVPDAPSEATS